jgi:integrase/recombinase XerD
MPENNIYKRGEIWWLQVVVKGELYRESLRTRDVKTARRLRDTRIETLKAEAHRGEIVITWKAAVVEWAGHALDQIAASTAKRYQTSLVQCESHLTPYAIDQIDGKVVQALINARRKVGTTPATIRRDLTAISQVLEFAEAQGWREGNPTLSKRRTLKERRDPIVMPSPADIAAIIDAAPHRFGALIKAALLTGCRQNELVKAKWRDFDKIRETLTLIGKGNKRRTIQLSGEAVTHFQTQPRTIGIDLIFHKEGGIPFKDAATDFVHLRTRTLRREAKTGHEIQRFRFHDLRHAFAVNSLRAGMSIYTLQKHLGHTSVGTTEIYLEHLTPEEAESAKRGNAQK